MDDKDLKALKDIDVPEPSQDARASALQMSLAAFEEAGRNISHVPQGSAEPTRLTTTFIQATWEWIMQRRMLMGTVAAGLLVAPIATHLMWNTGTFRNDDQGLFDEVLVRQGSGEKAEEAPQNTTTSEVRTEQAAKPSGQTGNEQFAATPPAKQQPKPDATAKTVAPTTNDEDGTVTFHRGSDIGWDKSTHSRPNGSPAPEAEQSQDSVSRLQPNEPQLQAHDNPTPPAATTSSGEIIAELSESKPVGNGRLLANKPTDAARKRKARPQGGIARLVAPGTQSVTGLSGTLQKHAERRILPTPSAEQNRDQFQETENNPVKNVQREPVSTFSIDVDTASYAFVRRNLEGGALPRKNAVRVEEMINYFSYDYPKPDGADMPFRQTVAVYPTPWNQNTLLMHIGIKGHQIVTDEKPRSNLVFLIDVSGSMQSRDKLPLLKSAFRLLVDRLEPNDTVSIVTYAGRAGTVLEPTKVEDKRKILAALDRLQSGGSTAGAQGIRQAYALAEAEFDREGINRVILATDGDFNVGISDTGELKRYIATKRKSGVFLSVLGFGQGNYNDHLMQVLAQNGNGNAAYIDSLREAQKVLVEEAGSTLFPIASDVKIQVEFNPALIAEYRLVGYETRALKREDFNNDKVDAGDIGSGHTVTAIYELTPVGSTARLVDELRYQKPEATTAPPAETGPKDEYAFLKIRYKLPGEKTSKLLTVPITRELVHDGIDGLSDDMRFAAAVAAFGQKLRGVDYLADYDYDAILALASGARGPDPFGYRSEFLTLVRLAKSLDPSGDGGQ